MKARVMNRIVVGWDGSGPSEAAVRWVSERESFRGGHVVLSTVIDSAVMGDQRVPAAEAAMRSRLETRAIELRDAHAGMYVTTALYWGDPYQELLSQSQHAELLVLGALRPQETGVRYGWSVGARLAATAECPVAIVPETTGPHDERIVVGVDEDSGVSADAAAFAAVEAERWGSDLHVVHAWVEPPVPEDVYAPDDEFLEELRTEHARILEDSVAPLTRSFPSMRIQKDLVHQMPARALLENGRGAALLVVGRRGYDRVQRLLLGDVSHSVVVNTEAPTIVVGSRAPRA
jgi:nucleotide-binding universal stress UspA family protein